MIKVTQENEWIGGIKVWRIEAEVEGSSYANAFFNLNMEIEEHKRIRQHEIDESIARMAYKEEKA